MYLAAYLCLLAVTFLSLAGAAIGAAQLWQGRCSDLRWMEGAQALGSACLAAASGILLHALAASDFTLEYVASYTERALPLFYRITAFWAGQSGSLLFWALMVSLCGTAFLFTPTCRRLSDETRSWFLLFFLTVMAFFGFLLSTWSNPFLCVSPAPADGGGLNPLLQNPGMIFHPPLLFLGYGGFVIPGCLALAQALSSQKDSMHWLDAARPFTLTGWLFLSAGIVLGGWWAYMELGWGGYWAWDPVENASLLPWLIGTAALHTGVVETRRGKLHRVNIFLMGLTTVSAFFATYLVRGNVVNSVHAFGDGGVGTPLLLFVLIALTVVGFVAFCARDARSRELGGLETREGFVVMTVWLLLALSAIVLLATLWPVISRLWTERPVGLDAGFYNQVCLPLFTVLLALLLVCPWLRWQGGVRSGKKLLPCLLAFCAALAVFWMSGVTRALPLMAASLAVAVLTTVALLLAERSTRAWMPSVMACLVHASVALMALAIAFSGPYKQETEVELALHDSAQVGPWTVTLNGLNEGRGSNYDFIEAELQLSRDGKTTATVLPQRRLYDKFQRAFSEATTYPGLATEFYVTLLGLHEGKAVLRMSANPLVNWLWIGGALMSLAPILGLSRRRRPAGSEDGGEERGKDGC
ncbi:cytochrome c-type biogenesis CcmF C-terminal domain-containing protein [uncultured Mailhella sp.]|uniref:heme lyase CcmF/NrfE family subunit n=1 Tax=uncultured Mailhella sp. TaxID=1981031 RepID=UPI0026339A2D|nr:cytochrome c-type biogenesis CcmF C-terminal domain-containing protein [uncultured Mailhella sp.]